MMRNINWSTCGVWCVWPMNTNERQTRWIRKRKKMERIDSAGGWHCLKIVPKWECDIPVLAHLAVPFRNKEACCGSRASWERDGVRALWVGVRNTTMRGGLPKVCAVSWLRIIHVRLPLSNPMFYKVGCLHTGCWRTHRGTSLRVGLVFVLAQEEDYMIQVFHLFVLFSREEWLLLYD